MSMATQVQWLAPSPLWNRYAPSADKTAFRSPALLRFATDTFMQDLQQQLAQSPSDLALYLAQGETWRNPAAGPTPTQAPLKLFQPVHARFYLVAVSLVCRLPGLPDHTVKANQGERITFVLRKLQVKANVSVNPGAPFDPAVYDEYAWIASGSNPGWILVDTTNGGLATNEDQLSLFNVPFGSNGSSRRIFCGMIPTGRQQAYVSGRQLQKASDGQVAAAAPDDPRKIEFQRQVLDPWADLTDWYSRVNPSDSPVSSLPGGEGFASAQGSAYILIDFANYLSQYLPNVWGVVQDSSKAGLLSGAQAALYGALSATVGTLLDASRWPLTSAITLAKNFETEFENQTLSPTAPLALPSGYPGPLLTDDSDPGLASLIGRPDALVSPPQRKIQTLVEAALDQVGPAPASGPPTPAKNPQNPQGNDWYIVRCVYQRPECAVRTLPAIPVISPPSVPFQLASYFDPDAPARMIQVALPVDTTPATLRKYNKNVAFMISDQLGQQMQRVQGLKNLMDGDVGPAGGSGLGMICSFSIPIITICAFFVLMIFLILLNIIFFWMPFFRICFPLPTFKAKGT